MPTFKFNPKKHTPENIKHAMKNGIDIAIPIPKTVLTKIKDNARLLATVLDSEYHATVNICTHPWHRFCRKNYLSQTELILNVHNNKKGMVHYIVMACKRCENSKKKDTASHLVYVEKRPNDSAMNAAMKHIASAEDGSMSAEAAKENLRNMAQFTLEDARFLAKKMKE